MASIDSPLKRLVSAFITDFASWLLKTDVHVARPLNVELPAATLTVDQGFHVTLANGHAVVTRLRRVSDAEMRGRLLTAFIALLPDEEMLAMTERLLEDDALLLDTPFLSRIREEGRMEGTLSERRRAILEALALRFTLPTALYHDLEQHLATLTDEAHLERLFVAAMQSPSLAYFQAIIADAQQS